MCVCEYVSDTESNVSKHQAHQSLYKLKNNIKQLQVINFKNYLILVNVILTQ